MSATAVHSLWTTAATAADPISKIDAPKIEYGQLAPTLIVVGAAVIGVLIEAAVPRKSRYYAQMFVATVSLAAAFAAVVALAADGYATTKAGIAAMGALAVDGPGARGVPAEVRERGGVGEPQDLGHRPAQRKRTASPACSARPARTSGPRRRGRDVEKS